MTTNAGALAVPILDAVGDWPGGSAAALYVGLALSIVTTIAGAFVGRRTSRAMARTADADVGAKGAEVLVAALARIDKEREDAERREQEAEDRAERSRLRESNARAEFAAESERLHGQVEELNGQLRECAQQVAELQVQLTAAQRQAALLQDRVHTLDQVVDTQGAVIRDRDRTIAKLRTGRSESS